MPFAHLHVHTEYSLLDGACRVGPLLDAAKAQGATSLAITDHGVMYGVVDFYKKAKAAGIHPVIGSELYIAPGNMEEKTSAQREYGHLVVLCENMEGYRNLTMLSSLGFTKGFYYRPRVDLAALRQHSRGLIALSACLSGDIPRYLLRGMYEEAKAAALAYQDIFGEGNFFLELQDHGMPEQRMVNEGLVRLSRETGIPLVATNDVHYLRREDAEAQEVLLCIQTGKTLADESRMSMSTTELYLKTESEMAALFPYAPDALPRTEEIAQRCQVEFDLRSYHLPHFHLPQGVEDAYTYLTQLCEEGIARLYGENPTDEVAERLGYELSVIRKMGYVDYMLIVWDFIRHAKEQGIMVGPGRGSSAGSIVTYALGITGVDPLAYGLVFERFLNPERVSMPDIDIDFCYERRQEVIDYVVKLYGEDQVAQIITFGTMAAKGAVRDVARVLGLPYADGDRIAKLIPFALDMTLGKALEISKELRALVEEDETAARLYKLAQSVEGMPRHASTHAAGVVIAASPLTDFVPLQKNDDVVTTQFPMGTIEELGLLKMDFLGLRTLTVLRDTLDMLAARGEVLELRDIPLFDAEAYEMMGAADTDGLFQLESGGMRRVLSELRPTAFEDIIAVLALYRPGPMESIPRFIEGKHNPDTVHYEHPIMERALSTTYGCMVYQEQVMQIVRDMAGYSMARSDLVRRAMSKKKRDVMEREREVFIHGLLHEDGSVDVPGAVRLGVPEKVAEEVFALMERFAEYAFPKAHATAYAMIAVQTAYLKRHYPVEFMAASMNSIMGNTDKIAGFIQYCRKRGIDVLPPDVNTSGLRFTVEGGAIRFGLTGVRNVGEGVVQAILAARKERPFDSIFDLCDRVEGEQLNKRALESLIKAGALDSLPGTRLQLLDIYEQLVDAAQQTRRRNVEGQVSLFGEAGAMEEMRPALPPERKFPMQVQLQFEKEMTGVYISGHPLEDYREALERIGTDTAVIAEMAEEENGIALYDGRNIVLGGMVAERRMKTTRNNQQMCFITLEDLYGQVELLVFPRTYEQNAALLTPEAVLVVRGRLSLREDDTPKVVVERLEPLLLEATPLSPNAQTPRPTPVKNPEKVTQGGATLYLRVPSMEEARRVRATLLPGTTPIVLKLEDEGRSLRTPAEWACWADEEALARLRSALGDANVVLKPHAT